MKNPDEIIGGSRKTLLRRRSRPGGRVIVRKNTIAEQRPAKKEDHGTRRQIQRFRFLEEGSNEAANKASGTGTITANG